MALRKYTLWQKIRSFVLGSFLGAVLLSVLVIILTATGIIAPPLGVGFIFLTIASGATIGGVPGVFMCPRGDYYEDGYSPTSEFHTDRFYLDNFNKNERETLEQIQFKYKDAWLALWANFKSACDSLKPKFESEIPLLRKALLRKLLRLKANASDLNKLARELEQARHLDYIDDRFEEIARICDLLVLRKDHNGFPPVPPSGGGAAASATADIARSFSRAECKTEDTAAREANAHRPFENRRQWQPSEEQWQQWQQEQVRGFFKAFMRFFANLFSKQERASQQSQSVPPPKFTELENFVILDHHNPYEILEVSQNASAAEIKKAYKKAMLKWHPDKNIDNAEAATEKTKEITRAQEILTNPVERHQVDIILERSARNQASFQFSASAYTRAPYAASHAKPDYERKRERETATFSM